MTSKKVLLGVTGSIAAYKACDLVRRLQDQGCDVHVVMTESATQFVTPLTFSGLTAKPVYTDMFSQDQSNMPHIHLAQSTDLFLVAPATASVIGKIANGIADDLLTCMALSTQSPMVIVPAMNTEMWDNTIVQQNCQKLRDVGYDVIEPGEGLLACGTTGKGHFPEVNTIVEMVKTKLDL